MKTINKISALFMGMAVMASCSDSFHEYEGAANDVTAAYEQVAFASTSDEAEFDPTETRSYSIEVTRNTKSGAIDVPVQVLQNDSNVYKVPEKIHFNDGDSVTSLDITFPDAKVGLPYTLQVQLNTSSTATSEYAQNTHFALTSTVIQWNEIGTCTIDEDCWYGAEGEATVYQKDNDHDVFRIVAPFDNMTFYSGTPLTSYLDGNQTKQFQIELLHPGDVKCGIEVTKDNLVYFETLNTGDVRYLNYYGKDVELFDLADLYSSPTEDELDCAEITASKDTIYEGDEDASAFPQQIVLQPYAYIRGLGGWGQTGDITINFPGYHSPYTAQVDADFDYEDCILEDAELISGAYASKSIGTASLYKGTCNNTTDDCDKVFAEQYGPAYCIPDMYVEGYNIYFAINKDGEFTLPEGCDLQNTGLTSLNEEIYAKINTDMCELTSNTLTLTITFQNADGTIDYGTFSEVLSKVSYTTIGTGTFTYNAMWSSPRVVSGIELQQRDDDPNTYRLAENIAGVPFIFTLDEDNTIRVGEQEFGYEYGSYGPIYLSDAPNYDPDYYSYEDYPCSYDPATKTYTFNLVYYVSAGQLTDPTVETFVLDGSAPASIARAAKAKKTNKMTFGSNVKLRKNTIHAWKGKSTGKLPRFINK